MRVKYKVILTLIVVIGVIISVMSCVNKEEADVTVAYIGYDFVNSEAFEKNSKAMEEVIKDITGDSVKHIDLMEISFNDELSAADKSNSTQKLANAIGAGNARVYFIHEDFVLKNMENGVFCDISSLGEGIEQDGKVIAISLKGNKKLEGMGIKTDEKMYIAVRSITEIDEKADKNIKEKHESAMNIAKFILSE